MGIIKLLPMFMIFSLICCAYTPYDYHIAEMLFVNYLKILH